MIEKVFKNMQSMHQLSYATTCGFIFEKFIAGKGMYGNRVSTIRSKDPKKLYNSDCNFKDGEFITIEGLKSIELPTTIFNTRQRIEFPFTSEECMRDFLATKGNFLSENDLDECVKTWHQKVGLKLLGSNVTDFAKLNNFMIGNMVLHLPLSVQKDIAEFRQEQILTYLTQDIIPADFAKYQLDLLPWNKDKLVDLKQRLIRQRSEQELRKQAQMQQAGQAQAKTPQDILAQSTNQANAVPQYEQIVTKTMPVNQFNVEPLTPNEQTNIANEINNDALSQERQAEV